MLKDIGAISKNSMVMVIYTDDSYLTYYIRNKINNSNKVLSNYIVDVDKKNLKTVELDIKVKPLLCDKWVIYYDSKILSQKEILESMQKVSFHSVKVFFIRDYGLYKKIVKGDVFKSLGVYAKDFYFGSLKYKDIDYLYQDLVVSKGYVIDEGILHMLKKDYNRSTSSIFIVFKEVVSGNEVQTKEDVIDLIGLGNNNIVKFFVNSYLKILNSKNENVAIRKVIKEMSYISRVMDHKSIKSMLKWAIEGFIEIKVLQIMGIYGKPFMQIPEGVNKKRIDMLRSYDWFVLHKISLNHLLCLLEDIQNMRMYYDEIELIRFIYGMAKYRG